MQSIVSSPQLMDSAVAMYSQLDHTLSNIHQLRDQQLDQMRTFRRRKKQERRRKRLNTDSNMNSPQGSQGSIVHLADRGNDEEEKKEDLHLNAHLEGIMQTLLSSTTEFGSLLHQKDGPQKSESTSLTGRLLGKLSSSIEYITAGGIGRIFS